MDFLIENNSYSAADLALKVGISQRKIESNIAALKSKGILTRIGSNKGGYWKVNEKENNDF